jgi:hypothetical protein
MPAVTINLMHGRTLNNDVFFQNVTREFYQDATSGHPKLPLVAKLKYGYAICSLPGNFSQYLKLIESSAVRNYKKALKNGFIFRRIDYNEHLEEIWAIRKSTDVRQGEMPRDLIEQKPALCDDPATKTNLHDYPHFGVFNSDNVLVAYSGNLVAGEAILLNTVYGHAAFVSFGIVPMLIIETAKYTFENYPEVRYFGYGTFFGAGESMRRFKKKFGFLPCIVTWKLD